MADTGSGSTVEQASIATLSNTKLSQRNLRKLCNASVATGFIASSPISGSLYGFLVRYEYDGAAQNLITIILLLLHVLVL